MARLLDQVESSVQRDALLIDEGVEPNTPGSVTGLSCGQRRCSDCREGVARERLSAIACCPALGVPSPSRVDAGFRGFTKWMGRRSRTRSPGDVIGLAEPRGSGTSVDAVSDAHEVL